MTGDDRPGPALDILLEQAHAASGLDRMSYRDPVSRHGDDAIVALQAWLIDPRLGGFAARTIEAAATFGTRDTAIAALRAALPAVTDAAVQRDIHDAITRLRTLGHVAASARRAASGATVVGEPADGETYVPPLSPGEGQLLAVLRRLLPDGWTVFVRPHLDGDRPALALLHRQRGVMIWDVRDIDLSTIRGAPKSYAHADGAPYLDPIESINVVRQRLYREYLPSWAEAIDERSVLYGIVRAGIYFPTSAAGDLERLGLSGRPEIVIGRGGLIGGGIASLVPNASRAVEMRDEWYEALYRRFADYHPPTFSGVQPSKRQLELIDEHVSSGWRGIEGVAGSGKSLVLARRAARLAREGNRVLLVTYNLTLANYCRGLVEDAPDRFLSERLIVQHFHGLCHALLRGLEQPAPWSPWEIESDVELMAVEPPTEPSELRSDAEPKVDLEGAEEEQRRHFEERWPQAVIDALDGSGVPADFVFDEILVDEAQDFSPAFFDVLARLLGEDAGVVLAFDRAQRIYARADGVTGRLDMRRVKKLNGTWRLTPRHAGIATALGVARRLPTDKIQIDDEAPRLWNRDEAAWMAVADIPAAMAVARALLETWRAEPGYRPNETAVLVPSGPVGSALVELLAEADIEVNHVFAVGCDADSRPRKVTFVPHDQRVKVSTIHSFKGWDAKDVVVVEPPTGGSRATAALYVALTRPSSRLVVVASRDAYLIRDLFDDLSVDPDPEACARASYLLKRAQEATHRRDEAVARRRAQGKRARPAVSEDRH